MRYQQEIAAGFLFIVLGAGLGAAPAVEVSLQNGRASVKADGASIPQILDAWARAGHVKVVNTTALPDAPVTLEIVDVPEREALRTVLRQAGGYIAVERPVGGLNGSLFERIVILPKRAEARAAVSTPPPAAVPPPVFPPAVFPTAAAGSEPDASGAVRLLDEQGQPVPDDQDGAPPPPQPAPQARAPRGFSSGDDPQTTPPVDNANPPDRPGAPDEARPAVPGMMPPIGPRR
jgi:hypothetical protein